MKKLQLTLACGDYEIIRPLKEGLVQPDGIELTLVTAMDSTTRHWRFLRNREFDVAELSASSYIIGQDRGLPFRAIPVFLHRRFRHGFVFVNTGKGITKPADLIGRRVGVKSYQVTAVVWLRGILEQEYGVPHGSIEWFSELDEDVAFEPPAGLRLTRIGDDKSIETMLAEGEIDALLHPDIIAPVVANDPRVGRLFPDYKAEEVGYFRKTGIFPIMHVMGLKQELAERHPWVATNLFKAFEESKAMAMKRMRNPRIVPLAWYAEAWDEQAALLGPDPWEYGLGDANRHNVETLVGYAHAQGLIGRATPSTSCSCRCRKGASADRSGHDGAQSPPASNAATWSAIASDAVRPGLSIPNRLTRPGTPWAAGPRMAKSSAGAPGPLIFGRIPAYPGISAPSCSPGQYRRIAA